MERDQRDLRLSDAIACWFPWDYDSEGAVRMEALDNVTTATGLANIEVKDAATSPTS